MDAAAGLNEAVVGLSETAVADSVVVVEATDGENRVSLVSSALHVHRLSLYIY